MDGMSAGGMALVSESDLGFGFHGGAGGGAFEYEGVDVGMQGQQQHQQPQHQQGMYVPPAAPQPGMHGHEPPEVWWGARGGFLSEGQVLMVVVAADT